MLNGKYATLEDLQAKWGQSVIKQLVRQNSDGTMDGSELCLVWSEVDAEIDSYLASAGYELPVSAVPNLLKSIAVVLAYGALFTAKLDDATKARVDESRAKLKNIASGKMKISLPTGATVSAKRFRASAKDKPKSIVDDM